MNILMEVNKMCNYDLVIIGAGVSGIFSAINSMQNLKVLVIDSNKDILEKFMITGKGKSNITNTLPIEKFLNNLIDSSKFLYPSLTRFNSNGIIEFLDSNNIKYFEKSPNRIHFLDDNEKFRAIIKNIIKEKNNISLDLNNKVINICKENNGYVVKTNNKVVNAKNVIVATGGLSYKNFGCDGSGYKLLESLGHTIIKQYPIGVGLITKESFNDLQGISVDDVIVSISSNKKNIYSEKGPLIFTHFGIGGPVIRRVSGYISKLVRDNKEYKITIQWLNSEDVINDIKNKKKLNECFKALNKKVRNHLLSNYDLNIDISNIKKDDVNQIINTITNYELKIKGTQPIDFAINTGGGVSLKEINPNTYESTINNNLYIVGEILDLNPRTNGFNITVCYSTAMTAITSINKKYS